MNENHEIRAHIADVLAFAEALSKSYNDLSIAAYDLREACRFYTEGDKRGCAGGTEESVQADPMGGNEHEACAGGSGVSHEQLEMEYDSGASRDGQEDAQTSRHVKTAKPEHLYQRQDKFRTVTPNSEHAAEILKSFNAYKVPIRDYYEAFRMYSASNALLIINMKGMRYLAYCCGWKKCIVKGTGMTYLVAP